MNGETQEKESGWTIDTLKAHFETRFELNDRALIAALASAEKAVTKAELAAEKRFDSVNEFRAQLADQAATFMPRSEAEVRIQRNSEKVDELTDRFNMFQGRDSGIADKSAISRVIALAAGTMLISIIGIVVAILIAL